MLPLETIPGLDIDLDTSVRHLGQVFTPPSIATFMASLLDVPQGSAMRVLEPGAGAGALIDALVRSAGHFSSIERCDLVEIDSLLVEHLEDAVAEWIATTDVKLEVYEASFVSYAASRLTENVEYDAIICNPPYVRLRSSMPVFGELKRLGVNVPNLYGAFMWLAFDLLAANGQLVAIVPRSFCSGAQFAALREHLLERGNVVSVHLFDSRREVFRGDRVLQETVIVKIVKGRQGSTISLSWSPGSAFDQTTSTTVRAERILASKDERWTIAIPPNVIAAQRETAYTSGQLLIGKGLKASTGSVVDFRFTDFIEAGHEAGTGWVPLVGARNFGESDLDSRDQLMLRQTGKTAKHILPVGNYVIVKRISPKEMSPRLRARVVLAEELEPFGGVAFENHINVIHDGKMGIELSEARRIAAGLSRIDIEEQFIERSGSTQVNVSDLMALREAVPETDGEKSND